jgi:hypothetical protein
MSDCARQERGTTLLEAVVAVGLLVSIVAGTASLVLLARRLGAQAETAMAATTIAAARLEALRAVPWEYDLAGGAPEAAALAVAPAEALDRNVPGFWDGLDDAGRLLGVPGSAAAAFVRRWAVWAVPVSRGEVAALHVCVFAWPAREGAPPLVCLASVRARQP